MSSLRWKTATTYGSRHLRSPRASVILMVSLPLGAGAWAPVERGVCVPLAGSAPSLLVLPAASLSECTEFVAERALVGVGGPLLKMNPRVSSLSPPRENHLFACSEAPELGGPERPGVSEVLGVTELLGLCDDAGREVPAPNCDCNWARDVREVAGDAFSATGCFWATSLPGAEALGAGAAGPDASSCQG